MGFIDMKGDAKTIQHILVFDCVDVEQEQACVINQLVQSNQLIVAKFGLKEVADINLAISKTLHQDYCALLIYASSYDALIQAIGKASIEAFQIPVIIVSHSESSEMAKQALNDGVAAFLHSSISMANLELSLYAAVKHYQIASQLKADLDKAKISLIERKTVERAKGILMRQATIDEDSAYRMLRTQAMNQGKKMVDIAKSIISSQQPLTT